MTLFFGSHILRAFQKNLNVISIEIPVGMLWENVDLKVLEWLQLMRIDRH